MAAIATAQAAAQLQQRYMQWRFAQYRRGRSVPEIENIDVTRRARILALNVPRVLNAGGVFTVVRSGTLKRLATWTRRWWRDRRIQRKKLSSRQRVSNATRVNNFASNLWKTNVRFCKVRKLYTNFPLVELYWTLFHECKCTPYHHCLANLTLRVVGAGGNGFATLWE